MQPDKVIPPAPLSAASLRPAPFGLLAGSEIQRIIFSLTPGDARPPLVEFKEPRYCRAVLETGALPAPEGTKELTLLLIPIADQESPELTAMAWDWLEPGLSQEVRQAQFLTLQGTRILWLPGKGAILAPANRLEVLRRALIEFAFCDDELRSIETSLEQSWPELEADTPLAFNFDDRAAARREALAERFQRVVSWRAKLARLLPVVHRPPVHPPTLASQLAERLRERTRMLERLETIGGQLEVFERVYELCSQRASDYTQSQESKVLEWIIILLLATETVVLLIGLMTNNQGT